jgi:selenide,water dikinase
VQVLRRLPTFQDPNIIMGYDTLSDAGVYDLGDGRALVQTVDVLTPIADDGYLFGQIVAANSMSDVYAMGAKPLTALNVLGYSPDLDLSVVEEIIRGGMEKTREAGAVVLGGHTIKDQELKYGLAVTGIVDRDKLVTNSGARPGDRLILTKPLGTGVISTALKADAARPEDVEQINVLMAQLNRTAAECMLSIGVNACTDITGFGFLGHLYEMLQASGAGARIWTEQVPLVGQALEYIRQDLVPGGSRKNFQYMKPHVKLISEIDPSLHLLLCDAQTSGGLLMAVSEERADELLGTLQDRGISWARAVGQVIAAEAPLVELV